MGRAVVIPAVGRGGDGKAHGDGGGGGPSVLVYGSGTVEGPAPPELESASAPAAATALLRGLMRPNALAAVLRGASERWVAGCWVAGAAGAVGLSGGLGRWKSEPRAVALFGTLAQLLG